MPVHNLIVILKTKQYAVPYMKTHADFAFLLVLGRVSILDTG